MVKDQRFFWDTHAYKRSRYVVSEYAHNLIWSFQLCLKITTYLYLISLIQNNILIKLVSNKHKVVQTRLGNHIWIKNKYILSQSSLKLLHSTVDLNCAQLHIESTVQYPPILLYPVLMHWVCRWFIWTILPCRCDYHSPKSLWSFQLCRKITTYL